MIYKCTFLWYNNKASHPGIDTNILQKQCIFSTNNICTEPATYCIMIAMNYYFSGYRLSPKQKKLLVFVADYACSRMSKRLDDLNIHIEIVKDLLSSEGIYGDAEAIDDYKSPKNFNIRLHYSGVKSFGMMTSTLIHELVHVMQFAKRKLRYLGNGDVAVYESKRWYLDFIEYENQPWEIEAYSLEDILFEDAMNELPEVCQYIHNKGCDFYDERFEVLMSKLKRLKCQHTL